MTTMQDSGVVDMSGAISAILRSYQDVLAGYQQMVTGDPDAIANAGTTLQDQASVLASASSGLGQRSTALSGNWEGSAYNAFRTATGQLTGQVDGVGNTVRQEAQRLSQAAILLRTGKSEVDSVIAQFQHAAQTLINESRTAAVGAVGAFVQAAQQLGNSAVNAAKTVANEVGERLAGLFGVVAEPSEGGEQKHLGSVETELRKGSWGSLGWFNQNDVLDGRKRPRSAPWSTFGNSGWWSVTGDGVNSAGAPLKANTPFGSLASPPADQTAAKLWHDTNITLANSGEQKWYDGSLVDDRTGGTANLGDLGTAKGTAEFDAGLRVTDQGSLSIHGGQFQAGGEVKATLVDANASGSYTDGPVSANAKADAMIGADAAGHITVGTTGVAAHVNAFAGAQATGTVGADVAGVGVGASGSLQAGVGVQLDGQATYANGHIVVNGKVGAALGLGASASANINIDVPKLVNTAEAYGTSAVNAVQSAAGSVEYAAGQAAGAIGDALRNAGPYAGAW